MQINAIKKIFWIQWKWIIWIEYNTIEWIEQEKIIWNFIILEIIDIDQYS